MNHNIWKFARLLPAGLPALLVFGMGACAARAQESAAPPAQAAAYPIYQVNGQATFIVQREFTFHSPYAGPNSFLSRNEAEMSQTYTLYLGARVKPGLEIYVDPEEASGKGLSQAFGLAGYTNGEVIRNPTLSQEPYLARYFVRWSIATGPGTEDVEAGQNQVPGKLPAHRLVLTGGKLGVNDIFDLNSYADSTRTQFMNWAFLNNAAYDYDADTRGYTRGGAVEWVNPGYTLRAGLFLMPVVANGIDLATNIAHNQGDQVELELHPKLLGPKRDSAVIRLFGYRNMAHMGDYREAVALAEQTGTTPDITKTEHVGAVKYGFGINAEQALGDGGDTGVWARWGWDDGKTESFAYTECDSTITGGFQLSGARWRRPKDRFAVALAKDGLSGPHRDYLAAGGLGFILGDGRLNYGSEDIVEAYYAYSLYKGITLSPDFQRITNPGYNRDRGPVNVVSLRLHAEF